jgi:hypothetical protein
VYVPSPITPQALSAEETKLRRVEESIRVFVRVADPKCRQIVPMRYFNVTLNPAEVDAYTADYLEQASPIADCARMLLRMVALTARMTTEMEELRRSSQSSKVWRLHADSLTVLLDMVKSIPEVVDRLTSTPSHSPAMQDSNESLRSSLEKLRARASEAEKLLSGN